MPLLIEKPASVIVPDKVLYVGGKNADALPDSMILLIAYHFLRVAVDRGCAKIGVKRGRWTYEFSVADMLKKAGPVKTRRQLGPGFLPMQLAGSWKDSVRF